MKKSAILTLIVFASIIAAPLTQAADLKVAVIDMDAVLKGYYKTEEIEARLKEVASGYQKELQDRRDAYGKLVDQIGALREEASSTSLSEEIRKEKTEALKEKIKEAQIRERENFDFTRTATGLIQDQKRRANVQLMEEISKVVESVSRGRGYDLVLVKAEFPSPVLYSNVEDLAPEIIKELNKDKPKK